VPADLLPDLFGGEDGVTDTRMLALLGAPEADAYELLFSFSSSENKAKFLGLLRSNEATDCEDEMILVPIQKEIDDAQPLFKVLLRDVFDQATLIAATLAGGQTGVVQ
jgi:hypothetical protein